MAYCPLPTGRGHEGSNVSNILFKSIFPNLELNQVKPLEFELGLTGLPARPPQYCIAYRFFYHCFLALLPLTLLFLAFHLFVENCKWNFEGEGGAVPRPWPHTLYLPLIWFFSAAYAVPTVFLSQVRSEAEDIYRNDIERRATTANVSLWSRRFRRFTSVRNPE